ncbi:Aste57867_18862 [Aphanomyces stellatus]|uniref:Aste57867_18862 protein n=1 Tax=Aphanomyces stellatus TaxID=120398 RepID=A0A485LB68_9STRA|nr:hypothetical protein As57867_018798 [Aphanomyces stellatus]VFT95596.1 Aste57867_18862 [Aphanomyces stellatus]
MFLVRLRQFNRGMRAKIHTDAASTIQHAWRTKKGKTVLATRVLKRKLSVDEKASRDAFLARQRLLAELEKRRQESAILMQSRIRGYLARAHVRRLREARRLDCAVRYIQASWRRAKGRWVVPGPNPRVVSPRRRYALHLRFLAQRQRLEWEREAACLRIQCQMRRVLACKRVDALRRARQEVLDARARVEAQQRHLNACATDIARVYRGHVVRRRIARWNRAARVIQHMVRLWQAKKLRRLMRRVRDERRKREREAATCIQRHARGRIGRHKAKRRAMQIAALARRRVAMAIRIQARARGVRARETVALVRRARVLVATQHARTLHRNRPPSSLELTLQGVNLARISKTQVAALALAVADARDEMQRQDDAIVLLQCLYRGHTGRRVAQTKLEARIAMSLFWALNSKTQEKIARAHLEFKSARDIQRVLRGFLGRRKQRHAKEERERAALREAYRRDRVAQDDKKKWLEQLDMEKFQAESLVRKELELKVHVAHQHEEIARLEAQAQMFKLQAMEAQQKVQDRQDAAWTEVDDGFGNVYFYNSVTSETSWERPAALRPKAETKAVEDREEDWEELYNPNTGQIYKHNRVTGAVKMNIPPPLEERGDVKAPDVPVASTSDQPKPSDDKTAPPAATDATTNDASKTKGIETCWRCTKRAAVKECVNCDAGHKLYCAACFTKEHKAATKKAHDFKRVVGDGSTSGAMCHRCDKMASYHCETCEPGFRYMCDDCFGSSHATAECLAHTRHHFRPGAARCSQCVVPPEARIATLSCGACQDKFCASCFAASHAKGKKAGHAAVSIHVLKAPLVAESDAYCTECDVELCTKLCNLCGDGFCDACFAATHAHGHKADHSAIAWHEMAQAGDWVDVVEGKGHVYYNITTKEHTTEKPSVLLLGVERHREMMAEKAREKKKAEGERDAELVALREQVKALEEEKEIARRQAKELEILNKQSDEAPPPPTDAKPLKKRWWKSKAQLEREKKEREHQVVLKLMMTKQREEALHREAMQVGTASYANAIVDDLLK